MSQANRYSREFEAARDELFGHINRCGVLGATAEQQAEWMTETVEFLGERYPSLSQADLEEIRQVGMRFCQPVIAHGAGNTALTREADEAEKESEGAAAA